MRDVLCVGEALWDLRAPAGVTFERASRLAPAPGGAAVNVALHLAKSGLRAGLCASVGDDALGHALTARIAAQGVDTAHVASAPPRTGLCFIERVDGDRRIVGYRAIEEVVPRIPAEVGARVLVLTGLLPSSRQLDAFAKAARRARKQGARVVVDLNARPRLWAGHDLALALPVLRQADLIRCSRNDLGALALDLDAARALLRRGAVLIASDGPRPTIARGPFGDLARAPRPVNAIDPTGAGDALTAGVVAAMLDAGAPLDGDGWARAIDRGHALARTLLGRRR